MDFENKTKMKPDILYNLTQYLRLGSIEMARRSAQDIKTIICLMNHVE